MGLRAKALRTGLKRKLEKKEKRGNRPSCLQPCDPRATIAYPAVKLGSSIRLRRQIVHRVVVQMSGIQKASNVINLIPESYVNTVQREGHHWEGHRERKRVKQLCCREGQRLKADSEQFTNTNNLPIILEVT